MGNTRTETRFHVGDWATCDHCQSNKVYAIHEERGDHAPFDTLRFTCESCGASRSYSSTDIRVVKDE